MLQLQASLSDCQQQLRVLHTAQILDASINGTNLALIHSA
jgi:hypothetical protein